MQNSENIRKKSLTKLQDKGIKQVYLYDILWVDFVALKFKETVICMSLY